MNKRIKLLAEQAGMEDYPTEGVNALYGDVTIQKFAELIVAECCKEIMYASVGNEDPVFAYSYTTHLNNTFGVNDAERPT